MTNRPAFSNFVPPIRTQSPLRRAITAAYRRDEEACLASLLEAATLDPATKAAIAQTAKTLVETLRANHRRPSPKRERL